MTVEQNYYLVNGILCVDHGEHKGVKAKPIYKEHIEGQDRKHMTISDLQTGKKFIYGAIPEGRWDFFGYNTRFGYHPRYKQYFEGEPLRPGQYFYTDQSECPLGGYAGISEILSLETQQVYVPSDFVWGERGYVFVPGDAAERPADGNPAKYELPFTKITVELKLHGRAKFEVATEVTENSMRIYRVYEPL